MSMQPIAPYIAKGSLVWLLLLQIACARQLVSDRSSGFGFRLAPREQSQSDASALSAFLEEATRLLPTSVKAALPHLITVSFASSGDLPIPACHDTATDLELAKLEPDPPQAPPRITLHAGLIAVIRQGGEHSQTYPCGHRTMYRLAQAAVIHAVLRAYDARLHISADSQFIDLHRFAPQGLLRRVRSRNQLEQRSPDPEEFRSPAESFAVHGEYFLLDPEYRCRLPASYGFFARTLSTQPFADAACQLRTTVYDGVDPIDIDPARVYAVHYLWASEGRGAQSRFGHAMLRLVICARTRPRVDASCELDVQDHVVLSFAANLHGDLRISSAKGLLGGYQSQLFVRPLPQVIIDYTERELRELYSFPLQLSRLEIEALVLRTLEIFWAYSGPYYFLTNNCGTETLSLLRAVLSAAPGRSLSALTPRGIRDVIVKTGLAERLDWRDLDALEQRGLFFPSAREGYENAYRRLRSALDVRLPRSLTGYLEHTSASERRALYLQRRGAALLSDLYALEGLAYRRRQTQVMTRLLKLYLHADRRGTHRALRHNLTQLLLRGELHQPWRWPRSGYGVPLRADPLDIPAPIPKSLLSALRGELTQVLSTELTAEHQELLRTAENQRWLAAQLLQNAKEQPVRQTAQPRIDRNQAQGNPERRQL